MTHKESGNYSAAAGLNNHSKQLPKLPDDGEPQVEYTDLTDYNNLSFDMTLNMRKSQSILQPSNRSFLENTMKLPLKEINPYEEK